MSTARPTGRAGFAAVLALGLGLAMGAAAQPGAMVPGELDEGPGPGHVAAPDDPHAGHPMALDDPHAGHPMAPEDPHGGLAVPDAGRARPEDTVRAGHKVQDVDAHKVHATPSEDPHADHAASAATGDSAHAHHNMVVDLEGMVMNHNPGELPRDCPEVSEEVAIRILAGREFAADRPGWLYGYDRHVWRVKPCAKVNVTLENRDAVRHQWMVHGLPRYLYPMGMFTLEVYGPGSRTASFIVPSASKTYLAHCDVPHHMEKGMKGQLVVGAGDGTLPSIPGLSAARVPDIYPSDWGRSTLLLLVVATGLGVALSIGLRRS